MLHLRVAIKTSLSFLLPLAQSQGEVPAFLVQTEPSPGYNYK